MESFFHIDPKAVHTYQNYTLNNYYYDDVSHLNRSTPPWFTLSFSDVIGHSIATIVVCDQLHRRGGGMAIVVEVTSCISQYRLAKCPVFNRQQIVVN